MYKTITVLVLALFAYTEGIHTDENRDVKESVGYPSCSEILKNVEQRIDRLTKEMGKPPVGIRKPSCLPDGTFAPKQCSGSQCACFSSDGVRLAEGINIGLAINMHCNCARALDNYNKQGIVGKSYRCDNLGNYMKKQCLGSKCFCVDPITGESVGEESVDIADMDTLTC